MAGETNRAQQVPNPLDGIDQQEAVTTLVDTAPISGAANQPTRDTVDQAETLKYIGPVPKAADFGEPSVSLDQPQIVKPTTGPELKSPQQAFDGIEEVELDPTTEEELGFDPEAIDATKIIAEVGAKIGDQSGVLLDNNNKPFNGMSASEYVSWFITEHAESAGIWNKTDEELGIMAGDYETALTSSLGEIKDKVDVRLNTVGAEKQTAVTAIASGLVASIVREALRLKQTTREVPTPLDTSESIADTIPAIAPVVLETQQPEAMATARVESNEELTTRRAAIMKSFGLPTDASVDEMRQAGRKNVNTTEGILKASVEKGQMTNEDMEARLDIIEDKNDGLEQELLSIDARLTTDQASIVEQKVQTVESMPPVADSAPTEHSLDPIVSEWDDDGSAFYDKTTPSTPAVTKESVTRTTVPSANRAEILGTIATPEQTYAPVAVPPEMEDVYVNKDTAGLAVGFNDGIKTLEDEPSVTGLDDDDFFGIRVDAAEAINKRNEVQTEIKNIRKRLDDLQEQERKIAKEYSGVFKKFTRWLNAEPDKLRGIKRTIETALQSLGKAQRQLEELAAEERGFEDYEQAEKNPEALLADRDFILENDLRFNPSKDAAMFRETHSSASLLEARKKKLVEAFSKTAEDRVMVGPEVYRKNTITIGTRRDVLVAQYRENIQAQIDKIVELEDAADQATLFPPISADDGVRVSRQSPLVASKLKNARSGKTRYLRAVSDQ